MFSTREYEAVDLFAGRTVSPIAVFATNDDEQTLVNTSCQPIVTSSTWKFKFSPALLAWPSRRIERKVEVQINGNLKDVMKSRLGSVLIGIPDLPTCP